MPKEIFISYRRDDCAAQARAVYERLDKIFGASAGVFIDLTDLPGGVNFVVSINRQLQECLVMLALIGRDWLGTKAPGGLRRIDDEKDYVRLELCTALSRGITLIPVLVDGASIPDGSSLPDDLKPMVLQQARALSLLEFDAGMGQIVSQLQCQLGRAQADFEVTAFTVPGQSICVTGNIATLGNWNPSLALPLDARSYPVWSRSVDLPANNRVEYKYLRKNGDGSFTWENFSGNRSVAMPGSGGHVPCIDIASW